MEKIALFAIAFCIILVAGCSGTSSTPAVSPTASPAPPPQQVAIKPPSIIKSGNYSLTSSIDHIEVDSKDAGKHIVNIYLRLTNTGNESARLVWYSKLTDKNGLSHGGVGVSHGGSGAQTFIFDPATTGTMRDYVTIDSDRDYAALKEGGATLDVAYADQKSPLEPITNLTSSWSLEPSCFP
ncbi:hypothetical protein [uncultured Methanoregula sp.]|uniref:hypothetical protein n=1 Tax=uncultured Methanoregula sp. TaxID=1005933 RepID=UPI002AAB7DB6|nr:hypothetical protein [uncultured Methanoregula sp.]